MKNPSFAILVLLSLLCGVGAFGQPADLYPLDLVKPGQTGYGKTIFRGAQIERFEMEVLGVLKNVSPKKNMILARLSGRNLEQTGVFAGMSGSPVYIENRLAGAVAFTFSFSKEPIAGITPIHEMIDIFKEEPEARFQIGRTVNPLKLHRVAQPSGIPFAVDPPRFPVDPSLTMGRNLGDLQAIATPLSFSGISARTIREWTPQLTRLGLIPVAGMGQAQIEDPEDLPLEGGSTVVVQLVRGDIDVSASGTVTHVSGDKIYAFGHPFLSIGSTDLPLNQATVLTVISSLMTSQKISAPTRFIGSIKQDRATGILGIRGARPKLIPVQLKLNSQRRTSQEFNFEVVTDSLLTPFLLTFAVHNAIVSSERTIGDQTLQIKCTISVQGQETISFENNVADLASSSVVAAVAAAAPVNFLLTSGFENVVMQKITIEIEAVEQTRQAILSKLRLDKIELKSGEETNVSVFLRKSNGETMIEKYPVKIPEEVAPGKLELIVADGLSLDQEDAESTRRSFVPANLRHLIRAINNLKKNDRLYIRLVREQSGAVVAGEGLPDLPPSLMALYESQKTAGDVSPINRVVYVDHELPATDFVLSGRQSISLNVK